MPKRGIHCLWAALVLACLQVAFAGKRSFTLPLHAKTHEGGEGGGRRKLLRNATLPLHGAVKDYG